MSAMTELIPRVRQYARERVATSKAAILSNLRRATEAPLVVDVALPGAAYFSVAAGGLCDVLHMLGDEVVKVDRLVGASGGACSLFLILANERRGQADHEAAPGLCPSSELLLQSYLEYAQSEGSSTGRRSLNALWQAVAGVSSFWEEKYRELLREETAWTAVRLRGFCAVAARPLRQQIFGAPPRDGIYHAVGDNYILHNFVEREEAVQAFVATGEATGKGFTVGIKVLASDPKFAVEQQEQSLSLPASFCDGGRPVSFDVLRDGKSPNALLYYSTWFESASEAGFCTPESIEHLYRRGVDRAIECLLSESLASPAPGVPNTSDGKPAKDSMVLALAGTDFALEMAKISVKTPLYGGSFVNLAANKIKEQRSLV